MKDVSQQIEKLNAVIIQYYQNEITDGNRLSLAHRDITSILYFLEETRAEIHDLWQTKVYKLVEGGASVSRAENEAHVEYPQMYQLRRLMDAGYRVADSIRTRISYLKNELNNIQ